ncbi:DctP family TRAP transporter solute-binding subunit [Brevibacillus sp. B_LB10_24]|uniref:TRAP transporter substrate-binding protein n=1 Tax=Brevibacillus sp. B_LB10_24 TaxID=3380645 RepID=UPI0038BC56E0
MNKRIARMAALLFHFVLAAALIGCSNSSQPAAGGNSANASSTEAGKKIILKVGHVFSADHAWQKSLEGMAKDVAEATNGMVEIQVFPSSQLGGDREVAEGMQLGTIEMGLFGTGALQTLDKRMIVEELPYAWPTREQAYAAVDGKLGEALGEVMKEKGLFALSWWESGYRHITNSKNPIEKSEDLKGLKLRVPDADLRIDTFKELGTLPTPMPLSEVFTSLQQGIVDGQENPLSTIYSSKFQEVQSHLALTGHIWGSAVLAISDKKWGQIPEDYQKVIMEKAAIWKEKEREMIRQDDEKLLAELEQAGMKITRPDVKEFREKVQPVWTKYESVFGKDLIDIVRQYSK